MKQAQYTRIATVVVTTMALIVSLIFVVQQKTYAAACVPGNNLGALTQNNISVKKAGDYKVWVRLQADQNYNDAVGIEVSPGGSNPQCFKVKNNSTSDFAWSSTPVVTLPQNGNKIRIVGLREKVKIDRIMVLSNSDPCTPDNLRNVSYTPVIEPGDNCLFPPTDDPVVEPGPTPTDPADSTLAKYNFSSSIGNWEGQGNTVTARNAAEGYNAEGALEVKVDQSGRYQDNSRTARAGTAQYGQGIKIGAGKKVSARMYIKAGSTAREARCEIRFYNNSTILNTAEGQLSQAGSNWSERTCSATTPANTTNFAVRIFIDDASYGEVFYVDDVNIVEGDLVNAPTTPTDPGGIDPVDTKDPSNPSDIKSAVSFDWGKFSYARKLDWTASTDNVSVSDYVVKRDGKEIGTSATTTFVDRGPLDSGREYNYQVIARDNAGNTSGPASHKAQGSCFLIWCWGN